MRVLLLLLMAAGWWSLQARQATVPGDAATAPPVSAGPEAAAGRDTGPEGLQGLWAVRGGTTAQDPDPVVLCEDGVEAKYLRRSQCQQQGGLAASEPIWARVD